MRKRIGVNPKARPATERVLPTGDLEGWEGESRAASETAGGRNRSAVAGWLHPGESLGASKQPGVLARRQHRKLLQRCDHEVDEAQVSTTVQLHHRRIR